MKLKIGQKIKFKHPSSSKVTVGTINYISNGRKMLKSCSLDKNNRINNIYVSHRGGETAIYPFMVERVAINGEWARLRRVADGVETVCA